MVVVVVSSVLQGTNACRLKRVVSLFDGRCDVRIGAMRILKLRITSCLTDRF